MNNSKDLRQIFVNFFSYAGYGSQQTFSLVSGKYLEVTNKEGSGEKIFIIMWVIFFSKVKLTGRNRGPPSNKFFFQYK